LHNTPFYGLIGEFSGTPVSNRPSALSWIFAGQSHYRTDLLRGESRRSPAALSVGEHILLDALPKRFLLPDLLGRYQTLPALASHLERHRRAVSRFIPSLWAICSLL
jgi:hypothetical protein